MKNVRTGGRYALPIICVLIAAVGLGRYGTTQADEEAIKQANALSRAFRSAAKKVLPTVVKVRTTTKSRQIKGQFQGKNPFKGTPFEEFFGDDDSPGHRSPGHGMMPFIPHRSGVGSGVIIDPKGIILTNNHVVEDADEVMVELPDGRQFKATDIKTDKQTDLAVLRIEAKTPLPAARLGDSSKMEIGDWVLAIGSPFELEQTVNAGIISGKGRMLGHVKRGEVLQTDAAINPGNSGGPLVNLNGEVVGINTAIASRSGGFQGIGFAIPINLAKWVSGQLIDRGAVQRAYLGVGIGAISSELAKKLGVKPHQGVLVSEVYPKTPAAAAGFQEGDVILKFAGQPVADPRDLQEVVERAKFGSKQRVDIIRAGKPMTLEVVVKSLPKRFGVASFSPDDEPEGDSTPSHANNQLGLEVADLNPQVAKQLGYVGFSGVLISGVDADGVAAEAGLREGMLILRVGQKPIKTVAEFQAAMKNESPKDGILLLIRTPRGNRFVVLQQS